MFKLQDFKKSKHHAITLPSHLKKGLMVFDCMQNSYIILGRISFIDFICIEYGLRYACQIDKG